MSIVSREDDARHGAGNGGLALTPLVMDGPGCAHFRALARLAEPRAETCEECSAGKLLRVCLDCGHVGCCDSRLGHARAHSESSGHRVIRAWKGGAFVYCYEHGYL